MDKIKLKTNMKKIFLSLIVFTLTACFIPLSNTAYAAEASLSLSPLSGGPFKTGSDFSLAIWAKTGGNKVDAIRASLSFPSNLITVKSIQLGSVYYYAMPENKWDNDTGSIYWGGGAPGGNTQDATFATITFTAKQEGLANISILDKSLMLSAGQFVPFYIPKPGQYEISNRFEETALISKVPEASVKNTNPNNLINDVKEISAKPGETITLEGNTNKKGITIYFNIDSGLVEDKTYSDDSGNWKWSIPDGLAPGNYQVEITAVDPQDNTIIKSIKTITVINTEAMNELFDVILEIDKTSKSVVSGENLLIHMKLLNFGANIDDNTQTDVHVVYTIKSIDNNKEIMSIAEDLQVIGKEKSYDKTIALPKWLESGKYSVYAQMTYGNNQEASSSDYFTASESLWSHWYYFILIVIAIIIIVFGIRKWIKRKK